MALQISEDAALFLLSEPGRALLTQVAALTSAPADQVLTLRKRGVSPDAVLPAVEVASARRRARFRFADADHLFFTGDALAQATSPVIAAYHAACLLPLGTVADFGCGVGMDTLAFAEAGLGVVAIERDAARLRFAGANAHARGIAARIRFVHTGDTDTPPDLGGAKALYADPSRRDGDKRHSRDIAQYEPSLSLIAELARTVRGGCVKLSPGLPDEVLDDFAASVGGRIEFLSESRECKEACVLWGDAVGAGNDFPRAAILLPEGIAIEAGQEAPFALSLPAPGDFALDPDPALIRAGALGAITGAALISPDDAYLTSEALPAVPRLASAYHIEAALPYSPRRVGEWLKTEGYNRLVVKKRYFPKEPAALARDLKVSGVGREITLILVRTGAAHLAILCHPCNTSDTA